MVIQFSVESIRFVYIIRFIIYQWTMWIYMKNILWIINFQKHSLNTVTCVFLTLKRFQTDFKSFENYIYFEIFYINLDIIIF